MPDPASSPHDPPRRQPDRIAGFNCSAECGRRFHLEGYGGPPGPDGKPNPQLELIIKGHVEPAPMGALMPMGPDWLMFWLNAPMLSGAKVEEATKGTELQLGNRGQVFGPYVLCRSCLGMGGIASIPEMISVFKEGIAPRSLVGLLGMMCKKAYEKNKRMREEREKKKGKGA